LATLGPPGIEQECRAHSGIFWQMRRPVFSRVEGENPESSNDDEVVIDMANEEVSR
jgi:hypothetical protein